MTTLADSEKWQEQAEKVERFVARFGNESYRSLVYHAALPLVLTPELVHYLRNEFLRGENVPWEAEVDLLLSDLCSQVGYELYAMDTQVRAYLLEQIRDSPSGPQRMQEVAQVLINYVNFLSRTDPKHRQKELQAQRLAAMTYLGDGECRQAVQEIVERLKQLEDLAAKGSSEQGIQSELAFFTRITQELAPQLKATPALVDYAKLVQRLLRDPSSVDPAEMRQSFQIEDVELKVFPRIFPTQGADDPGEVAGFPPLETLDFGTGQLVESALSFPPLQAQTVTVATLFFEAEANSAPQPRTLPVHLSFGFEIATIERPRFKPKGQWSIKRERGEGQLYEERLGDASILEMVAVPEGAFDMGSPPDEPERSGSEGPKHRVKINSFYMGRYPIGQAQWRFVAQLPQINQELNLDPSQFKGENRPVERVTWYEAVEFCSRLSRFAGAKYRLPSEAEWEYACRAGTKTPFHFGETISSELANYNGYKIYNSGPIGAALEETTPLEYFGIANAFGLCDMHGNVWEWCQDHWHGDYEDAPTDGSAWLIEYEDASRVVRGGSWFVNPGLCRSAHRFSFNPRVSYDHIGFRVVCSAP